MAISSSTEPRYRYYEEAPESITVPVSELLEKIPAEFRQGGGIGNLTGRRLDLACRDLFSGNTPRLQLGILHDLLPDLIRLPEGTDRVHRLSLPAGWLAPHYRLLTRREELPPEPGSMPVAEDKPIITGEPKKEQGSDPKADADDKPASKDSPEPAIAITPHKEKPVTEPSVSGTSGVEAKDAEGKKLATESLPPVPTPPVEPAKIKEEEVQAGIDATPGVVEKKRGFFASLPIFRRHQPARENSPIPSIGEPVRPGFMMTVLSEGKADVPSGTKDSPRESRKESPKESLKAALPESAGGLPKVTGQPAIITAPDIKETSPALERLWKLDPQDLIADPAALQAIFMTEEKLTLDRVMSMAGHLPGLRACVLAHGDQVVCASSAPAGMDLRNLSTQAMNMLTQIKESSEKMGLGAVPAITLHADQGVLSFLHQGELCLLVLHADRGFVPGVRERLQEMLGHLSNAKALPSGTSFQPTLPI